MTELILKFILLKPSSSSIMLLSTYHPSVSQAPELTITYPISHLEDEHTIPRRTTLTTFNHHLLSADTQLKVVDLLETLMNNEEKMKTARDALLKDPEFDPIEVFQRMTKGAGAVSTNVIKVEELAEFTGRPV